MSDEKGRLEPGDAAAPRNMSSDASSDAETVATPTPAAMPGVGPGPDSVGPYRLLKKLGQGGMGQVWLAEQSVPVRRQVALKLIRSGMDTDEIVARFESERQALAILEHPAIARVYEAGSTPDGRPYFAMELVDGVPITSYCDTHRLSVRQRIGLFMKVCEGVQYAHQKAILHRDLKPSNVLVTEQDGRPVPKIIDFGLAKALEQHPKDDAQFTQAGFVVGTPAYMSPEQAGDSRSLDTRSDVFALGVILYELLVGATPVDFESLPFDEALRRIRLDDPLRPSARFQKLAPESQMEAAKHRGADRAGLVREISGDLDWIVMKALERDRERRYRSPSELAADLQRDLESQPVIARPPSTRYRVGKFVRRHRIAVGSAAGFLVLLLAFGATMTVQAIRIARERDRAEKNRAEAVQQARLALDTIYLVVTRGDSLLGDVQGTGKLRKQLIEVAMQNLDQISRNAATAAWADRTMGVALQRMGDFYYYMGMLKEHTEVHQRAAAIFRRLIREQPGEQWNSWDLAVSLDELGHDATDPSVASRYFEEALGIRETLVRDFHQPEPSLPRRQRALNSSAIKLSNFAFEMGRTPEALRYAHQALSSYPAVAADSSVTPALRYHALATDYYALGRAAPGLEGPASAREALLHSVRAANDGVNADSTNASVKRSLAYSYWALADLDRQLGRLDAAMADCQSMVATLTPMVKQDANDQESLWLLRWAQYLRGGTLRSLGRESDAKMEFEGCFRGREEYLKVDPENSSLQLEVMLAAAQLGEDAAATRIAREQRTKTRHPGSLFSIAQGYALCSAAIQRARLSDERRSSHQSLERAYADTAIAVMRSAVAGGYQDRWTLEHDPDLQGIRDQPAFQQIVQQIHP